MMNPRQPRDPLRLFPGPVALGIAVVALTACTLAFAGAPLLAPRGPVRAQVRSAAAPAPAAPRPAAAPKPADPWAGYSEQDLAYWRKLPAGGRLGHITIPRAGADIDVVKGAGDAQLVADAGFVMGTDYPGPNGNAAIGAHRTLFKHPFRNVDVLRPGDVIIFRSPFREYRYTVTGHTIVRPTDVQVLRHSTSPIITIIACHPPGSDSRRYIVRGELTSVTPLGKG